MDSKILKFMKQIFRCEICGKISEEGGNCKECGIPMMDLNSSGCMSCQGCGHH